VQEHKLLIVFYMARGARRNRISTALAGPPPLIRE